MFDNFTVDSVFHLSQATFEFLQFFFSEPLLICCWYECSRALSWNECIYSCIHSVVRTRDYRLCGDMSWSCFTLGSKCVFNDNAEYPVKNSGENKNSQNIPKMSTANSQTVTNQKSTYVLARCFNCYTSHFKHRYFLNNISSSFFVIFHQQTFMIKNML